MTQRKMTPAIAERSKRVARLLTDASNKTASARTHVEQMRNSVDDSHDAAALLMLNSARVQIETAINELEIPLPVAALADAPPAEGG